MKKKESKQTAVSPPPQTEMEWVATLTILQNKVVRKQLSAVFLIPLLVLFVILTLIFWPLDGESVRILAQILAITGGILLALLLAAIFLVYGGKYEYKFHLDERGVRGRPHGRTARKNKIGNALLILSGQPGAAGAGLLAAARQEEYVAWQNVDAVVPDERDKTITLRQGKRPLMVIPCGEAHFTAVLHFAQAAVAARRGQ
jgi:hypothetical protein